jgi:outer membrane protein assembly factor BamB
MLVMATIIIASLSIPFVQSTRAQTATSRDLGITPQLERKDTYMLDLQYPLSGPDAWDIPHENISSNDEYRCIKAAISMVDSYYGGHLSQDRIMYHVFHEFLNYSSPKDDLGDGSGWIVDLNVADLLVWATYGASVERVNGKPDFSDVVYLIDHNHPIVRDDGPPNHLITVIDGYDTDGQMVYLIDPLTGTESKVPYDSLNVYVVWAVTANNVTARSDEPTIWRDSDGDGVVDFDEINRFQTNPYNNDTYGFGLGDKTMIKLIYRDNVTFPAANFEWAPKLSMVDQALTFDASGSKGNITSYVWNFGDGNMASAAEPVTVHAYDRPGSYNVILRVTDSNGLWNTTTSSISIYAETLPDKFEQPFYRESLDRKGFAPVEGLETPGLLWMSQLNGSVKASPAVADGMVFVGTLDGEFYALDLATGEIIWTFNAGSPISSSPAFKDGLVFFGTEHPGKVYAVDAYTGLVRWLYQVPMDAAVYSSPAIVYGMVVVGGSDGNLYCLDERKGQLLWVTHVGPEDASSPAVEDGVVFVTSNRGACAVDLLTGTFIWTFETAWPVTSCPAVADGMVFVASENDDRVFALINSTGKLVWVFQTGGWLTAPAVDSSERLVIVNSKDTWLYGLDEFTGDVRWGYVNGVNDASAPTISANGLVYVGSPDGNIHCVNETTGKEVWKYGLSALPIISSPTVIFEHVLVGTQEGRIYNLGPPISVPNIAISNLTLSRFELPQGYSLQINATANNLGNSDETFNMTAYANGTAIDTEEITVMNGSSITVVFTWNTTGFAYGNYTISAYAWPVPGETNTEDNNFTSPVTVSLRMLGDVMQPFGIVDMRDVAYVAKCFGQDQTKPLWDPNADINGDGVIDMRDVAIVAKNFGKTYL